MDICNNPDVLSIFYIITTFVEIAMFAAPVILIILIMIDLIKGIAGDPDKMKSTRKNIITRIIAVVILLLVPLTIEFSQGLMGETELEYLQCFTNANIDEINDIRYSQAEEALALAESKQTRYYYDAASLLVAKITDSDDKDDFTNRLETLNNIITSIEQGKLKPFTSEDLIFGNTGNVGGTGSLTVSGYYTDGKASGCTGGGALYTKQPDPAIAINYWDEQGLLDASDFIYPEATDGTSLGAWPANFREIPEQLTNMTFYNGNIIWPVEPLNGIVAGNYGHNGPEYGYDITTEMGAPVYAPASGTLVYSEWGNTTYRRCQDTAYSVRIELDTPVQIDDVYVEYIFITHLMGIVQHCPRSTCETQVKVGQLIGFAGHANEPHLHLTFYDKNIKRGVNSDFFDTFYNTDQGLEKGVGQ